MSKEEYRCKITILQRNINRDLANDYLDDPYKELAPCEIFKENQEFIINGLDEIAKIPEGFCAWAWADIRKDIAHIMLGGENPGMKQKGIAIVGCTDWFRPVIFKIERIT
ncbi:MAG: TIGR04076 family protein [Promethearchaeota archaeon]